MSATAAETRASSTWSDRLNPILVREVMQAVKGRAFALTVMAALAISVVIALAVVRGGAANAAGGQDAFGAGLATLVPLLLFVVPMQAYQSMRLELRAGIVEQLFLSRLRPRGIVAGKLAAAMVQFVLYVSVLAPLLATSYLLRGVDLPTIALSLLFALVFTVAATAAAISAAAQGVLPALQPIANVVIAFGLGMASFGLMGYVATGEYLRDLGWLMRNSEFGMVTSAIVLACLCGTALSSLVAQSFLMHAFENRSTAFRVFLFAMVPVSFGWMFGFVDSAHWVECAFAIFVFLLLLGAAFGVFMVTEQRELSPRLRAHAPRHPVLAVLAAPFLPGRDRGVGAFLLYGAIVGSIAAYAWWWSTSTGVRLPRFVARLPAFVLAYSLGWLTIARALRSRLPASQAGTNAARFLFPILFVAVLLAPVLFDVLVFGEVDDWHPGHVLNPFWTIDRFSSSSRIDDARPWVIAALASLSALQLPACFRGVREVLVASAARRAPRAPAEGRG